EVADVDVIEKKIVRMKARGIVEPVGLLPADSRVRQDTAVFLGPAGQIFGDAEGRRVHPPFRSRTISGLAFRAQFSGRDVEVSVRVLIVGTIVDVEQLLLHPKIAERNGDLLLLGQTLVVIAGVIDTQSLDISISTFSR